MRRLTYLEITTSHYLNYKELNQKEGNMSKQEYCERPPIEEWQIWIAWYKPARDILERFSTISAYTLQLERTHDALKAELEATKQLYRQVSADHQFTIRKVEELERALAAEVARRERLRERLQAEITDVVAVDHTDPPYEAGLRFGRWETWKRVLSWLDCLPSIDQEANTGGVSTKRPLENKQEAADGE